MDLNMTKKRRPLIFIYGTLCVCAYIFISRSHFGDFFFEIKNKIVCHLETTVFFCTIYFSNKIQALCSLHSSALDLTQHTLHQCFPQKYVWTLDALPQKKASPKIIFCNVSYPAISASFLYFQRFMTKS